MNAQDNSYKTSPQAMPIADMHTGPLPNFEQLSALMDAELPASQTQAAMRLACSKDGKQCWHMYHLIGDVLRAQDLAAYARDEQWLVSLSTQLAQQPPQDALPAVVPTPAPVPPQAANDDVFAWKMAAGFASFAAVAVIGWHVLGSGLTRDNGPQLASKNTAVTVVAAQIDGSTPMAAHPAAPLMAVAVPTRTEANGHIDSRSDNPAVQTIMLRDPHLDELLAEHRQAAGTSALSNASGFLRNAIFEGPAR